MGILLVFVTYTFLMKPLNLCPLKSSVAFAAAAFCFIAISPLMAENAAPAAAEVDNKALYKAQVAAREKRADVLLAELKAADDRIEATVDRVLETLKLVGDSKDSRTKVARLKEQTINGMQKNIADYQRRRAAMQEELRRPTLHFTAEEKQKLIAKFDARIEKRVQQILDLSKTLASHQDYERYKTVDNGWYGTEYVQNEDFKQNKRLTKHTDVQREEILKGLKRSIETLERQNKSLQTQSAAAKSEAQRKMLQEEISKNEAMLKTRRDQLSEALKPSTTPTNPISAKDAQNMDFALRKTVDSLKREITDLFGRYSAYLTERSNVNAAKAALQTLK